MNDNQRPDQRPLAKPTVQVENDRVIVTEWRFPPGGHTGWHKHMHDYVVVPVTTGELHIFDGKASGDSVSFKAAIKSPMPLTLEFTASVAGARADRGAGDLPGPGAGPAALRGHHDLADR